MDVLLIQLNPFGKQMQRLKPKQETELENVLELLGERSWKELDGSRTAQDLQAQLTQAHRGSERPTKYHTWAGPRPPAQMYQMCSSFCMCALRVRVGHSLTL